MQPDLNRLTTMGDLEERTLKPVVKLLLVAGSLLLLWGMVSNLPGIDALIPGTGVSFGALVGALLTIAIVTVLVYVAVRIEPVITQVLRGPADVVADVASIAKHALLFVAVLTAHSGLAPLVTPILEGVDLVWTYDLLFLVLALVPTAVIAIRLIGNLDAFAAGITGAVTAGESAGSDAADAKSSDDSSKRSSARR